MTRAHRIDEMRESTMTRAHRIDEMRERKHHAVRTVPISNRNIAETEAKFISLKHIYMTFHFRDLA